ncbi:MAG: LamG-like jellyroll fold domain-containing protein [Candidatus Woesebacteria bacterium]|nr:LamG-like jellyroll fold domain-containing protein [Candidatus Woesebacteria bacterium]
MDETNKLDIKEGSISFWTKANQFDWSGDGIVKFFEKSFDGNSIFILKDSDSRLKFFHVYLGKGRTNVEIDVKNLDTKEKHFIVATWSVNSSEISLYVDGGSKPELVRKEKINYGIA